MEAHRAICLLYSYSVGVGTSDNSIPNGICHGDRGLVSDKKPELEVWKRKGMHNDICNGALRRAFFRSLEIGVWGLRAVRVGQRAATPATQQLLAVTSFFLQRRIRKQTGVLVIPNYNLVCRCGDARLGYMPSTARFARANSASSNAPVACNACSCCSASTTAGPTAPPGVLQGSGGGPLAAVPRARANNKATLA